ncbi:MAG: hypothetical protein FJ242_02750 [Nitrospira sp.]|nr:hypothetical protein [Nitrospira sp.]
MKKFWFLGLFMLLVLVSGCAHFTSPARKHILEKGSTYWFDYTAERRGAILIPKHEVGNIAICAEPSPDVALQIIDKFKADVEVEKVKVGAEVGIEHQVVQLAKRSQTIMFLRESLYRLCELSLNFQFGPEKVKELYDKVIDAAVKMAEAELKDSQRLKIEAETRMLEVKKQLETWEQKIDLIISYVQEDGKVNEKRLRELTENTGLEEAFKKFYGRDIEEFKKALKERYIANVDALAKNIKR